MSWVKLDDRFPDNLKVNTLSDAAFRAYVTSICYSARELTDGFITVRQAKEWAGKPRVVQELVPGLWELCNDGFRVHDYLKYNPTRKQVTAEREAARKRMYGVRSGEHAGEQLVELPPTGSATPVNPDPPHIPDPVTPIPPEPEGDAPRRTRRRPLSQVEGEIPRLSDEHPGIDVAGEFKAFGLYLQSKGKTYLDYVAAFENWLRNEVKYERNRNQTTRGPAARQDAGDRADAILAGRR